MNRIKKDNTEIKSKVEELENENYQLKIVTSNIQQCSCKNNLPINGVL